MAHAERLAFGDHDLPSLGRMAVPGARSIRLNCGTKNHENGPGWQALRTLDAEHRGQRLGLVVDDLDPYRSPGIPIPRERLPLAELACWGKLLREAWPVLVTGHPTAAEEIAAALRVLTPLPPAEGGDHVSATFYSSFGAIGTTSPPDALWFAVTLVHEVQHTKLTALLDLVPLVLPDDGDRHYAPWREDPRPLSGLFQGTYAHMGIAAFWSRQRHVERGDSADRAQREFARWRACSARAARTLAASGRLTNAGERFVAKMTGVLDALNAQHVPSDAEEEADRADQQHRERWKERNGMAP